ncbi:MAG: hypothetical protein LBC46_01300 [Treponema sp.]|jgi:hypothetical protein|nr:hypothetical protein [Treponema sp.]
MQFKAFEPGIEVNGHTVYSIVSGLGYFTNLSRRYLSRVGIGTVVNKELRIDKNGWYLQTAWFAAFENIAKTVGDRVLFNIGMAIPSTAQFPSWVVDVDSGVRAIDVAYHLNHRKNGKLLFNPDSGIMLEGIGHYGYERISGENKIISTCKSPCPCAYDHGIITAMVHKFAPRATIIHDDSKECRSKGADSCTYVITW